MRVVAAGDHLREQQPVASDGDERKRLHQELDRIDLSRLNERERFLVEVARSRHEDQPAISDRYLASHPEDPWALFAVAGQAWEREEWDAAAGLYTRLLQVDPNWVLARNNLGYLAMAQARFAAAEEQFRTYAYVAPDQANPHDSLGELLSLVGRYEEARSEFERALSIRPDFCASYEHLAGIAIFEGRPDEMPPVIAAGREEEAAADEAALEKYVVESRKAGYGKGKARSMEAQALHAQGVRKLSAGEPQAAAELFRSADLTASYWGVGEGRLKLFNLLNLALALDRTGVTREAEAARAKVRAVNPAFASTYAALAERTPGPR